VRKRGEQLKPPLAKLKIRTNWFIHQHKNYHCFCALSGSSVDFQQGMERGVDEVCCYQQKKNSEEKIYPLQRA
jgi:hypothetical protein